MASKGMSNLYGNNTRSHKAKPSGQVDFQFASKFNPATLKDHFIRHGKEMNAVDLHDYERRAIKFANNVDKANCICRTDSKMTTYKYNIQTRELVIVSSSGMIISYFKPKNGFSVEGKKVRKEKQ